MCRVLALLLLLVASACGGGGTSAPLHAGAGTALLPIPVGHSHAGYLQSRRLGAPAPADDPGSPFAALFPATRAVQSPPRAKAVVLESGGRRLVLAQLDAIFVTAELTERVAELARERLGREIGGELILHATHTHASAGRFSAHSLQPTILAREPDGEREALAHGIDTFSAESTDRLAGAVVEAIGQAFAQLRPARFGWGTGVNETASRDRRCHDDWIGGRGDRDTTVTVLRLDDAADGAPIAVLFHFALHGTLYDHDGRSLSVDAPGHVEYEVARRFDRPVVAIFLQGAAAAASPNGDPAGHRGSQAMQRVADDLAATVLEVWAQVPTEERLDLSVAIRRVPLDARRLGYRHGEFPTDGAMLCHFLDPTCTGGPRDPAALDCLGRAEPGGGKYRTHVAAVRLGDLAVLTLPGEPSAAVGRALAAGARSRGYAHGIPLGYSLDHDGYILLADDWLSGGSETNITFWGWRYADYVVEQSLQTLESLASWPRSEPVRPEKRPSYDAAPVVPAAPLVAPGAIDEPPAEVERLQEVRFAFHGADPALGTPEIRLQREEAGIWTDVRESGWIPVSNHHGPWLPTFYEALPSYREDPAAAAREHRWATVYEPPRDLPTGTYRLEVRGPSFTLASRPFAVVPSTAMWIDGKIDGTTFHATLLYPERQPVYAESPRNAGWQVGGFRSVDPRFPATFTPALGGTAVLPLGAGAGAVEASFEAVPLEAGTHRYEPGRGPGFRAQLPAGTDAVEIPAGALRDEWGNHVGAPVHVER